MQEGFAHTFASDVYSGLLVHRQVLDTVCGDHSDIGDGNLFTAFGLFAGYHPGLYMPVNSMINAEPSSAE